MIYWNILEMIMLVCTFCYCMIDLVLIAKNDNAASEGMDLIQYLMIVAMFFRWTDILKFLRFNAKFSNLIMLVGSVISDIKYFLIMVIIMTINIFICLYIIICHGFTSISLTKYEVFKQTYSLLLGNYSDVHSGFGSDDFTEYESARGVTMFVIFVIASLLLQVFFLLQVTMLNLLISIIGDTYGRISA